MVALFFSLLSDDCSSSVLLRAVPRRSSRASSERHTSLKSVIIHQLNLMFRFITIRPASSSRGLLVSVDCVQPRRRHQQLQRQNHRLSKADSYYDNQRSKGPIVAEFWSRQGTICVCHLRHRLLITNADLAPRKRRSPEHRCLWMVLGRLCSSVITYRAYSSGLCADALPIT
jgi:hypothetical protein